MRGYAGVVSGTGDSWLGLLPGSWCDLSGSSSHWERMDSSMGGEVADKL